ncbi:MAG: hypothetical protein Q9182_000498 [Xanthomendoza sp. 2 TL-2023]
MEVMKNSEGRHTTMDHHLDLTTALRPSLLPDETLLFVQDTVGLYEGKFKIPGFQTGYAYLTSHRACYVDNAEPRQNSVAINLKEVEKYEFYGGFLKSSAKVLLSESPGPSLENQASVFDKDPEVIKFSFRAGGEKIFYERLKGAMTQRKWLLQNAPPIPKFDQPFSSPVLDSRQPQHAPNSRPKVVGIAGLERRGLELRKNNETVIGSAFEDLEALMASAKEVIALAERFAHRAADKGVDDDALLVESATALGMVTTKNMLGSKAGSESLYLSELSRNVAEFLTDDAKGILRKEGGIMSLVDLWAVFNRTRGGVELVSPADFEKAARLWDTLNLPVRLRQFKNGLLVVQQHDWTDDKTVAQLLTWLQEFHVVSPNEDQSWDVEAFGRGVTAQEAAMRFGWSIGVASEELEMAEEKGAVCREEGVEGIKYWENWLVPGQHGMTKESLDI